MAIESPGLAGLTTLSRPQFLGNPGIEGHSHESQAFVAKEAAKARPWPWLPCFSRPRFYGKRGKKPGKPGQAGLCQAYRAFDRANNMQAFMELITVLSTAPVREQYKSLKTPHFVENS